MRKDEQIKSLFQRVCCDDNIQAYNELYIALCTRLIHFSASIVSSFHLAEEIVSDVFIALWQKRNDLLHVENPVVYLYVSTKNLSLNTLQQQKRHQHHALDHINPDMLSIAPEAENGMVSAEVSQKIERAIRSLPARCQVIFRLIKQDRLSYREVATLLNISSKTVDAQLTIAVKKISQAIRFDLSDEVAQTFLRIDS
ncbi:RNA polymerase sigma-70 factor (ECF subfamily) [Chitinophaga polysaccharea]|uniref:RNA polymerase sigma-70 factor n=2 Tax=Chitinophaga TaxID=79328 RepID=A0A847SVX1_9BACT|nr:MULTISPECIES: RNA polymerase sigma-70 factor [Chitinophaga]NLR82189.1 RNA polymerase sigma-70 factor [Chitinophaga eiseniae]TWF39775.1 RNA polymerase sigma-70 factor (ECF subfamily) [Chitinophaga polysaccharea]